MDGYMTKLRSLAPALLLAVAPAAAFADDYRFEASGAFDREVPDGDSYDVNAITISGTWYFKPVSIDGVPLAEAAFLGRSNYLSAVAARYDGFVDTDQNALAAGVGYYIPGTMFFISGGATRMEAVVAVSSTVVVKRYDTSWFGTLGIAPMDGLLIATNFREDGYDPNISARHVGKLPNGHFYTGSVSYIDPEFGDSSFGLGFDYYLDESTSLGVGYEHAGERWELRAEKFFSKSWAAGVSAHTADGSEGFGLNVTWRH
jgi:hypothetical protein